MLEAANKSLQPAVILIVRGHMKAILPLLLLVSTAIGAEEIKPGLWVNTSGDYECVYFMGFDNGKYNIYNDCYGPAETGIVEIGSYQLLDGFMILTNRVVLNEPSLVEKVKGDLKLMYTKTNEGFSLSRGQTEYTFKHRD